MIFFQVFLRKSKQFERGPNLEQDLRSIIHANTNEQARYMGLDFLISSCLFVMSTSACFLFCFDRSFGSCSKYC